MKKFILILIFVLGNFIFAEVMIQRVFLPKT